MLHECAGYVKDEFWQRLVHQLSEEELAVQDASIAMSSIYLRITGAGAGDPFGCALAISI